MDLAANSGVGSERLPFPRTCRLPEIDPTHAVDAVDAVDAV